MVREHVKLDKEKETLLIPLYSKAEESKKANPILQDPKAVEIVSEGIVYDFSKLKIPAKTKLLLTLRAKQLDNYVQAFLEEHPSAAVVHLGCGLDNRFGRVDNGRAQWYDLDFPEVIDLRRKFYSETERYHFIPSSVTDLKWLTEVPANENGKYMFVAEGLLMYLQESEVKTLFAELYTGFPGSRLAFDAFSTLTVRNINKHPSIEKTAADVYWGLDDTYKLKSWVKGLTILDEWYFSQSSELDKVSFGYKIGFKVAGLFPAANNAHRIILVEV